MTRQTKPGRLARLAVGLLLVPVAVASSSEFAVEPTWSPVSADAAYDRLNAFLSSSTVTPEQQAAARQAWRLALDEHADGDPLDRVAAALSKTDSRAAELVTFCAAATHRGKIPEFAWLADSTTPQFVRNNLQLYLARWLVQQGYNDEAITWLAGLRPADVLAPEALLFYRAVAHHRLVQPDEAHAALGQLLECADQLAPRYRKLAELMEQDLGRLQDDSLDHISRRMDDIRRRLSLGRSGERVQTIENGVIESLDKLIEQAEQQRQQQQAQAAAGGGSGQPGGSPMQESQIAELKAPGTIERRDIGHGTGWGNLPEKDREKALQEIGREFPSHYREVIEQYFRRLASEEAADRP